MNFIRVLWSRFEALICWIASHRHYRLMAVNPCTRGWMYHDSIAGRICLIQSSLADPGVPLEINPQDAAVMLNSESGLGWEAVDGADRLWFPNIDELTACAQKQLIRHGARPSAISIG